MQTNGYRVEVRDGYDKRDKRPELTDMSARQKKLIYFHGFGSSAASGTAVAFRRPLRNFEVIAPDIPVDPRMRYHP